MNIAAPASDPLAELFRDLAARDIHLRLDGGALAYSVPPGGLDAGLKARLLASRGAVLERLRACRWPPDESAEGQASANQAPDNLAPDNLAPASLAQERIWVSERLFEAGAAFHITAGLRLPARFDPGRIRAELSTVAARHATLRTRFRQSDGVLYQVSDPDCDVPLLRLQDEDEARQIAQRPFDLAQDAPWRAALGPLQKGKRFLVIVLHHIAVDGVSLDVLLSEFTQALEGAKAPEAQSPVSPTGFARWQRAWLKSPDAAHAETYWAQQLTPLPPPLDLSLAGPRPVARNFAGATEQRPLAPDLADALRSHARARGMGIYTVVLAAWAALLARMSGQQDFCIGVPMADRFDSGLERAVGLYLNMMPLPVRGCLGQSFFGLSDALRDALAGGITHARLPFERLVERFGRDTPQGYSPLFNVACTDAGDTPRPRLLDGEPLEMVEIAPAGAKYDLTLFLRRDGDRLCLALEYRSALFDREGAGHILDLLEALLTDALEHPDRAVADLRFPGLAPRVAAPPGPDLPRQSLPAQFQAMAARLPDATAISDGAQRLSYAELLDQVRAMAAGLRRAGVGRGDVVAIALPRSVDMVAALLAVLEVGGCYLPLGDAPPQERLSRMLAQAAVRLAIAPAGADLPCASITPETLRGAQEDGQRCPAGPGDLAYLIFTSGSTGLPKPVAISHGNVAALIAATAEGFRFAEKDVWTLFHSSAFDFSVWEIFGALLTGGRLVVVPYEVSRAPERFVALLATERVTVLNLTPSAFRMLQPAAIDQADRLGALRLVIFGGEALVPDHLRAWIARFGLDRPQLVNMYGITETTVHVTWRRLTAEDLSGGIGAPLPGVSLRICDARGHALPAWVVGELVVGGSGVARGYLGRPSLTAERFICDPCQPGARLYRSGDLGRARLGGDFDHLGRNDRQIKLRGFRIELGEVEAALEDHPGVAQAVAAVQQDGQAGALWAWVVPAGGAIDEAQLRAALSARLPVYMIPARILALQALPLTGNGKVDLDALAVRPLPPEPQPRPEAEGFASALERRIAGHFEKVLGRAVPDRNADFFVLGGDSMQVVTLAGHLTAAGLPVDPGTLYRMRSVAALAQALEGHAAVGQGKERPEAETSREAPVRYPMTLLQRGMHYHMQITPEEPVYHCVLGYGLQLAADPVALQRALADVTARHAILRSLFDLASDPPQQEVQARIDIPFASVDLRGLSADEQQRQVSQFLNAERGRRFDIEREPPWRITAHLLQVDRFWITFTHHHALLDGWSVNLFLGELLERYRAYLAGQLPALAPPPATRFADYVARERAALADPEAAAFWQAQLAQGDARPLPSLFGPAGAGERMREIPLPPDLLAGLRAAGDQLDLPLKSLLLAAHVVAVGYLTWAKVVRTGLTVGVRPPGPGSDAVLGLFVNTLPLCVSWQRARRSFAALAQDVWQAECRLMEHRFFPGSEIQRQAGGAELFPSTFNFTDFRTTRARIAGGDLALEAVEEVEYTHYPFGTNFTVDVARGHLRLLIEADPARYGARDIARFARVLRRVLLAVVRDPAAGLDLEACLDRRERDLIRGASVRGRAPRAQVPRLLRFFEHAALHPEAPALIDEGQSIAAGRLAREARAVAGALVSRGIGAGDIVALDLPHGRDLVTALLGVLAAGAGFMPLDPGDPPALRQERLSLAGASLVLVQGDRPPMAGIPVLGLDAARAADPIPPRSAAEAAPAYVLFTSGSTGRPKAVQVSRRALELRLQAGAEWLALRRTDRHCLTTAAAFDPFVSQVLDTLTAGAALVVPPLEALSDMAALAHILVQQRCSVLDLPPSRAARLAEVPGVAEAPLRLLLIGGEAVTRDLANRLLQVWPKGRLFNCYGLTETTIDACNMPVEPGDGPLPVGYPTPGATVYLLDAADEPVPLGVAGVLHVGGGMLADGYLGAPRRTAKAFRPDPFSGVPGARLYCSGDLARRDAAGALVWLGRGDRQIKLRGIRLEPGQLEAALLALPGVTGAHVMLTGGRLMAYLTGARRTDSEIRAALRARVSRSVLPQGFLWLDALPVTAAGKIDEQALAQMQVAEQATGSEPPRTRQETALCQICGEVLKLDPPPGRDAGFLDLGGHSLAAAEVVARLRLRHGLALPLRALLEASALWRAAETCLPAARPEAPRGGEEAPATPGQESFVAVQEALGETAFANMAGGMRLSGALDPARLQAALTALVARHSALRSRFLRREGQLLQQVLPLTEVPLPIEEIPAQDWQKHTLVAIRQEVETGFDLGAGRMMRVRLLRLGPEDHILVLVLHHAVSDGISVGILASDLWALYRGERLSPPGWQMIDAARALAAWRQGPAAKKSLSFWQGRLAGPRYVQLGTPEAEPAAPRRMAVLPWHITDLPRPSQPGQSTPFARALTALALALHRVFGSRDIRIGTMVSGRDRPEAMGTIGLLANTVVLRLALDAGQRAADLLPRAQQAVLEALAEGALPFEDVLAGLDLSQGPPFEVMLLYQDAAAPISSGTLQATPFLPGSRIWEVAPVTTCRLVVILTPQGAGYACHIKYDADWRDEAGIRPLAEALQETMSEVRRV